MTMRSSPRIFREVEALVMRTGLRPGTRLPPERELAGTLGASRASVRQALAVFEHWGLLAPRRGGGGGVGPRRGCPPAAPAPLLERAEPGSEASSELRPLALGALA